MKVNAGRSNWLVIAVLLLLLTLNCVVRKPAPADPRSMLQRAIGLYTGTSGCEDHAAAKDLFLKAAGMGDPLAKMWVANTTRTGLCGFKRDSKRAQGMADKVIDEVRSLAGQGNVEAAYLLGIAYCRSLGVTRDKKKGLKWLVKAAEAGHAESMDVLARVYYWGWFGAQRDLDKSFAWRLKAAETGHAYAMASVA